MISRKEYARRRQQLMRMTGRGAIIVVRAAPVRIRNNDVHYPYRQDSDFLYLTGFREPDAALVLIPADKGGQAIMFCRERDPKREMWDGPMAGLEGAVETYGMDQAFSIGELDQRLPELIKGCDRIFFDLGHDTDFDHKLIGWMNQFRASAHRDFQAPDEIIALDHLLHDMRLFKSRVELTAMRRSARVAIEAHTRAMQRCRPGLNEADIHAELLSTFTRHQCETSYLPIVGAGANACVLHYIDNRDPLKDGDLLLIDAGAEYDGYASDITRTFPVNGRFSPEQRDLYEVVLEAQRAAIDRCREGQQWDDVHEAAVEKVAQGLLDLGIISGSLDEVLEKETYADWYVHKTGHWLGLDVHDVGDYQVDGHSRALEKGMVFTVEPGVYIRPDDERVDQRWRGLGIRIEDNVVVTRDDPEILTSALPNDIEGIEALMSG
ncbi:MAG: aminopeptidase P N-terminal domain-containing protein [Xanthomonadales bacterium]|nr:aminopeptidase P N-terminal domain-containing protein [Xanthomonadales bacterium]